MTANNTELYATRGYEIKKQDILGYCLLHKMVLNKHRLVKKECVKKGCFHLKKVKEEYWLELDLQKYCKKLKGAIKRGDQAKADKLGIKVGEIKKRKKELAMQINKEEVNDEI